MKTPILLGVIVRLAVAVVLVILGAGIEGEQPFEQVGVDRHCDQHAPGGVAAAQSPRSRSEGVAADVGR